MGKDTFKEEIQKMSSDRSRRCCLTWRRLCGWCCFGSKEEPARELNYKSGRGRKAVLPLSLLSLPFPRSDSGYCEESLSSTFKTSNNSSQVCPSSESEELLTGEPTLHIPPGLLSWWSGGFHETRALVVTSLRRRVPGSSKSADQESSQTQESEETCLEEETLVPLEAPKLFSGVGPACHSYQFLGPEGNVDIELIDESANRYSVHFPMAGFYLWPATRLGFLVTAAVTVRIALDSWSVHMKLQQEEQWMVAGPLFDISVEPEGVIAEIHLPHIISLPANEVDMSWFHVAHFKDEGMVLEPPARVESFYAVLENPSFSLMGILLRLASGARVSVPITSTALLYYHFYPEDTKFHLYLIPSDSLLTKAIDEEETKFHGVRLQTSPPVEPLNFGSRYIVSGSAHLEIMPEELKLSYRSPGEIQVFSKVFAGKMEEPIILEVTDKRHKTLVWRTLVKPVELQFCAASPPSPLSAEAFMKKNHRHLQARLGDLSGVLDDLQDSGVFTEEEKELVQQLPTRQRKNETLLRMVEKKGPQALEIFFRSLQQRDPYLMSYLSQQSLQQ
ncbi:caspase recruitment domain-containing protein 8-like isoform X1 [Mustela erminea]|uniref:caspase recruitment domain-containing protein 8-like isoform X1 n=1 Tax=Mustela erminea TaxID=36723 RepID=UPI001386D3AF|nr:caspase recruitment domain-containing protein 8-like isoform X1 [Mustela erminea]XP_032179858.1 caspase recruitment domain-containing protein 8-like isoform X1 [Mustela erminea]XP_032179859.1 caspase recruitment domain-containing protein 8-like isoform X1 [Mustela erminea]